MVCVPLIRSIGEQLERAAVLGEILYFGSLEHIDRVLALSRTKVYVDASRCSDADEAVSLLDHGADMIVCSESALTEWSTVVPELPLSRTVVHLVITADSVVEDIVRLSRRGIRNFIIESSTTISLDEISVLCRSAPECRILVKGVPLLHLKALDDCGAIAVIDHPTDVIQHLAAAVTTLLQPDPARSDGLFPTVVVDEQGVALGLVYSNADSITAAITKGKGIFHSRKRGLWEKGLTSGAYQDLLQVSLDCDRDTLRFVVHQHGAGFCHLERRTCWSSDAGLPALFRTLESRRRSRLTGSYTNRLMNDTALLESKLREECNELLEANTPQHIAEECADVFYFASVVCAKAGVSLSSVETALDRRARRVRRRPGNAKPAPL